MTFLETKLLEYFRACDDKKRIAIFEIASYLADHQQGLPADPGNVQTSISDGMTDQTSASEDHPQPAQNLRHHASYIDSTIVTTAQKAVIPEHYQLTSQDISVLYDIIRSDSKRDPFNALCFAFDYGFVKGNRATRRGKVKAL